MQSQAFSLTASPTIVCPGAYLSAAGRAVLATGLITEITLDRGEALDTPVVIEVFDAYDVNGITFRSTGRKKREIDLTGATAMRQSVFEIRGTAITGGPTLSTYNRKALFDVPSKLDGGGVQIGGQTHFNCRILCLHGMIVRVTSHDAADVLSLTYRPYTLGKAYHRRATHQIAY